MTAATVGAAGDGGGSVPAADVRVADGLEVPRPLRLFLTAGWSLAESAGLPVAACALGAWIYGRDAGLVAGLAAIWVTAVIRKVATGSVPSLLVMSAVVLTLGRPGGADGNRAGWRVLDALERCYCRARRRRDRRVHLVVPFGPAQARAEAPFRLSLSPAATTGHIRAARSMCWKAAGLATDVLDAADSRICPPARLVAGPETRADRSQ